MNPDNTIGSWITELTPTQAGTILTITGIAVALIVLAARLTRGQRYRAREQARVWAQHRRTEWDIKAAAKADRTRQREQQRTESAADGSHTDSRLRKWLMVPVGLVALAATNLSGHATVEAVSRIGLDSFDTAMSALIVFELFLAIFATLSWSERSNRNAGFNRYDVGVWSLASLMGGIAWWGSGSPIFMLWPLLAAIAWHVVITFGRHEGGWFSRLRARFGRATSEDATRADTERRLSSIVRHGVAAHHGARLFRRARAALYRRALESADERGLLDEAARGSMRARAAERYVGARALAPDAVAHANPWDARARAACVTTRARIEWDARMRASETEQIARTTDARAESDAQPARTSKDDASAHDPGDAHARTQGTARTRNADAPEETHAPDDARALDIDPCALIAMHLETRDTETAEYAKQYWAEYGTLPTGTELAQVGNHGKTASTVNRWLSPLKSSLETAGHM